MYKIYINETPLYLTNNAKKLPDFPEEGNILQVRYPNKAKFILNYVDLLEKKPSYDALQVYSEDLEALKKDFKSRFKRINAAGGMVFNPEGKVLMIFRRGFWDLPKGKIDPGEGKKEAAIREVQEETGIQHIELGERLLKTYHTYKDRQNKRILKCTYWYRMTTTDKVLIPQTEEDIEKAVWRDPAEFLAAPPKVYKTILEVLEKGCQ